MDFIFMLTRADRTVDDAAQLVDAACDLGVAHVGFKDMGARESTMRDIVGRIRRRGATSYLEVVSESAHGIEQSLAVAGALGVDCVLGGTDLEAAERVLGGLSRYFPFAGAPSGHPTRLQGTPARVAADCARAAAAGCAGVDLLAYRATESDPLDLVRAARAALSGRRLIVAGSVHCQAQIAALAAAGVDAFTIGSAVFERTFSPGKPSLGAQIRDILAALR